MKTKFPFGQIAMTPGVEGLVEDCPNAINDLLARHGNLEQGELSKSDYEANQYALSNGYRIFSAFKLHGQKVWIITEYDRSVTTLLLPEEY
jgi:hypothetical protein